MKHRWYFGNLKKQENSRVKTGNFLSVKTWEFRLAAVHFSSILESYNV